MKLKTKYFLLLICSLFFLKAEAKVTLTSIWVDNMVLQQQSEVTFYGKASPGKRVYVSASWNNRKISTVSNQDGRWELVLPTPEAGGPYTITFSDGEELMLKNILIGEVWFCSGQSNMEMPVKGFRGQPGIRFAAIYCFRSSETSAPPLYCKECLEYHSERKWDRRQME